MPGRFPDYLQPQIKKPPKEGGLLTVGKPTISRKRWLYGLKNAAQMNGVS
jgi:hypothetical protein